jgi:UDP-N-acetyl-D-mannosaminouronate:lipid I N-acetyl-D-mannosaminouronosyltransferase
MSIKEVSVNNVKAFAFYSKDELLDYIGDKNKILIALNAEKVLKKDKRLVNIINNNIGYSDGISIVWALKKKGIKTVKIPGVEIWYDIIKKYKNKSYFFIGSTQEVIEKTVENIKKEYPDLNVLGYRNGFLNSASEKEALVMNLLNKKPDVIFVAQGSPKQEFLMEDLKSVHPALYVGLGGSFDVYCGKKKRAPSFFIKNGIEWLYRLLKEPTRFNRQTALIKYWWLFIFNKL